MSGTRRTLYQACAALFAGYPEAVRPVTRNGSVASVTLMTRGDAAFYLLTRDEQRSRYAIHPWKAARQSVTITQGTFARDVAPVVERAITDGIVLPRAGALFGWKAGKVITELMLITQNRAGLAWTVMGRPDVPPHRWSPFMEGDFTDAFWASLRAGDVVNVGRTLAHAPGKMRWIPDTPGFAGSLAAVAYLITGPAWHIQPGVFAWADDLRARPVPSARELLADPGGVDPAAALAAMYG